MEFITVRQAAEKWHISERTVQQLCTQGRIPGAQKFGVSWAIPADAEKPADPRRARQQRNPLRRKRLPSGLWRTGCLCP